MSFRRKNVQTRRVDGESRGDRLQQALMVGRDLRRFSSRAPNISAVARDSNGLHFTITLGEARQILNCFVESNSPRKPAIVFASNDLINVLTTQTITINAEEHEGLTPQDEFKVDNGFLRFHNCQIPKIELHSLPSHALQERLPSHALHKRLPLAQILSLFRKPDTRIYAEWNRTLEDNPQWTNSNDREYEKAENVVLAIFHLNVLNPTANLTDVQIVIFYNSTVETIQYQVELSNGDASTSRISIETDPWNVGLLAARILLKDDIYQFLERMFIIKRFQEFVL